MQTQQQNPTFNLTITYSLSQEGQIASLRAGGDGKKAQAATGVVSLDDALALGLQVSHDGASLTPNPLMLQESGEPTNSSISMWKSLYFDEPRTFDQLLAKAKEIQIERERLLKEEADRKAAEKAETQRKRESIARKFLADPGARGKREGGYFYFESERFTQGEVYDEMERRAQADKDAVAREEREREEAKTAYIAQWVREHGTDNQRERLEANLLPRSEILAIIKGRVFAALDDKFSRYEKITAGQVRETCSDACACEREYEEACEVTFDSGDQAEAAPHEWDQIKQMRALLPDAQFTLRWHEGICDDGDCPEGHGRIERHGIYVKLQVGPFTFNREYAVMPENII